MKVVRLVQKGKTAWTFLQDVVIFRSAVCNQQIYQIFLKMLVELILVLSTILGLLYYVFTKDYGYWKKRGVKYKEPSFILGNFVDIALLRKPRHIVHKEIYNAGRDSPYIGIIQTRLPALYIRDPEYIRYVLAKDFPHFHDRGVPFSEKRDPLSAHLFSLEGARWRNLRIKLTPTFTSGKMKTMLPLMQECADEMLALLEPDAQHENVVEMREILARFTTDVIGTCAFGVQCNSLRNPNADFRKMGSLILQPSNVTSTVQIIFNMFPELAKYMPMPPVMRKVTEFFLSTVRNTVKYREENNVERNDLLDLLIQIKKKGTIVGNPEAIKNDAFVKNMADKKLEDFEFTENLMAAQAFVFFVAGFETSATTLSYALLELAHNPRIQEKLRDEIDEVYRRHGCQFTFEGLMHMPYLDKVVSETLRMYPPAPLLVRKVTQQYKMPNSDFVLEKGLRIFIPVHALHHDPEIYPDPEKFDPERFSKEVAQTRHNYAYLPFGEGPRNCIGQRFGLLQVKLGLATLLEKFSFEMGPNLPYPPVISKPALILLTEHGTDLRIKRRPPRAVTTDL